MQSHHQSEFCANLTYHEVDPCQGGYPTWKRLRGKIWPRLRAKPGLVDRATRLGGTYHVNVITLKWDIIWTGGFPYLHVNRPCSRSNLWIDNFRWRLTACLHGGGGPQVGEVTGLGGVTRQSIYSLILIWSRLPDRWGDPLRRVARSARPGSPLSRGQILPCKCFKVGWPT